MEAQALPRLEQHAEWTFCVKTVILSDSHGRRFQVSLYGMRFPSPLTRP